MEFWGVEVKPGQTVKCEPGEDRALHLSLAALGETKGKGAENVPIFVKINDQKLVIGSLSSENWAQISYDLVFEKEFELSHGAKNVSVYFCGYKSDTNEDDEEIPEFESDEDVPEEIHDMIQKKLAAARAARSNVDKEDNGVAKPKAKAGGATKAEAKLDGGAGGATKAEAKPDDEDDDEDNEEDEDDDSEGSDDDDGDMMEVTGNSDDDDSDDDEEDDESSDEEEATPKKSANGKKRPAESASKTPVHEKKAKLVTPAGQKTGGKGKKGAHVATPHPAKQSGKAHAHGEKAKQQTPKSVGSVSCKSCSKSFNSDTSLQAHTKAKHGGGK